MGTRGVCRGDLGPCSQREGVVGRRGGEGWKGATWGLSCIGAVFMVRSVTLALPGAQLGRAGCCAPGRGRAFCGGLALGMQ